MGAGTGAAAIGNAGGPPGTVLQLETVADSRLFTAGAKCRVLALLPSVTPSAAPATTDRALHSSSALLAATQPPRRPAPWPARPSARPSATGSFQGEQCSVEGAQAAAGLHVAACMAPGLRLGQWGGFGQTPSRGLRCRSLRPGRGDAVHCSRRPPPPARAAAAAACSRTHRHAASRTWWGACSTEPDCQSPLHFPRRLSLQSTTAAASSQQQP